MAVNKTIAIIAANKEKALAIASKLARQNYRLLLVLKDTDQSTQLSHNIKKKAFAAEAEIIDCMKDGCWEADIIFLAIPADAEKEVVAMIKEVATQKIVVSISSYENDATDAVKSLQNLLPYSKVVNAFNTSDLSETFITGCDEEAVQTIFNILKTAGYHPTIVNHLPAVKTL